MHVFVLQGLECRILLSVKVDGSLLTVMGTPNSDTLVITSDTSGTKVVLNGVAEPQSFKGVTRLIVQGLEGNDVIDLAGVPKGISATVQGGEGNDTIRAGDGSDVYSGGGGLDQVSYAHRTDSVTVRLNDVADDGRAAERDDVRSDVEEIFGGEAADLIVGGDGHDSLDGQFGNDTLIGGRGNDRLVGNGDDDSLDGGPGADNLQGDTGIDTVDYSNRTANLVITIDGVPNDGEDREFDNVRDSIEVVKGGAGDDSITGGGPKLTNGIPAVLTNPNEPSGANLLLGGRGNDTLNGAGGNDTLVGGRGRDVYSGGEGPDGFDSDFVSYRDQAASVNLSLNGSPDDGIAGEGENIPDDVENLEGGRANDTLAGNAADNILDGGPGTDVFVSNGGNDTVSYASHTANVAVTLDGVANDGQAGERENVPTGVHNVIGGWGNDTLTGDRFDNLLRGDPVDSAPLFKGGADVLVGGRGNDTLDGGLGVDTISGGRDVDTADYSLRIYRVKLSLDGVANDGHDDTFLRQRAPNQERDNLPDDIEILAGGLRADTLTGNSSRNTLTGNGGDDVLDGGAGAGSDVLEGGDGNDVAAYSGRTERLILSLDGIDNDGAAGAAENDEYSSIEGVAGGAANDSITGNDAPNILRGGPGIDTIVGLGADDTINGGTGADEISGGDGSDTADYSDRLAPVFLSLDGVANDGQRFKKGRTEGDNLTDDIENLLGGRGSDVLTGNALANVLTGDPDLSGDLATRDLLSAPKPLGNDTLIGNDGDDTLDGGVAVEQDVLRGGRGSDSADYSRRFASLTISLDGKANDGDPLRKENDRIWSDVENVLGGHRDDTITGDARANDLRGNEGNDLLDGGLGADTLRGGDDLNVDNRRERDKVTYRSRTAGLLIDLANDSVSIIGEGDVIDNDVEIVEGTGGDDGIMGDDSANILIGGPGNDTLVGRGGADTIDGQEGNDVMDGGANGAVVTDGDVVDYSARNRGVRVSLNDTLANDGQSGETDQVLGVEKVFGGSGEDVLTGGSGAESLVGNGGADTISGGAGDDTLRGENDNDLLQGDDGADELLGGDGEDVLQGGNGVDKMFGGRGNDVLLNDAGPADARAADRVEGGADFDFAQGDDADSVSSDVEQLVGTAGAPPSAAASGAAASGAAASAALVSAAPAFAPVGPLALIGARPAATPAAATPAAATPAAATTATAALDAQTGILTVNGTAAADRITLRRIGGMIEVTIANASDPDTILLRRQFRDNVGNLDGVPGVTSVMVNGGAGNDRIDLGATQKKLRGAIDDPATLLGGGKRSGNDTLIGGLRGDVLDGGTGADVYVGGPGDDKVNFANRVNAVRVTLNNQADDGESGEGDMISNDVENIVGGGGADVIDVAAVAGAKNLILGGLGNDTIRSGLGADILVGDEGRDVVDCGIDTSVDLLLLADGEVDTIRNAKRSGKGRDAVTSDATDTFDVAG